MSKILSQKIKASIVLFLMTISFFALGLFTSKAETFLSLDELSLTINGAEVFHDEEEDLYGLEFTISLPAGEYELLKKSVGAEKSYAKMETGIIIAPAYYADELAFTPSSLFSEEADYDWAEYVDGEYVYSGDKIRVININVNYWINKGSVYTYSGAIVDILEENETEVFCAFGYIKLVDNGGVQTFKFTETEKASAISTAIGAIEKGKLNETEISWVKENWVGQKISETATDEVLVVNVDEFDEETYSLLTLTSNNDLSKKLIEGFADKSALNVTMTDQNGNIKSIDGLTAENFDVNDDNNLRLWAIEIKSAGYLIWSGNADLYSLERAFVWNDVTTSNAIQEYGFSKVDGVNTRVAIDNRGEDTNVNGKTAVKYSKSSGNGSWFVWKPIHTKSYYENFTGRNLTIKITIIADGSERNNQDNTILNQGFIYGISNYIANAVDYKELSSSIRVDDIVENWDSVIEVMWNSSWSDRSHYGMTHIYNLTNNGKFIITGLGVCLDSNTTNVDGGEILVDLDKAYSVDAVDLREYLSESDIKIIDEYSILDMEYTLTSVSGQKFVGTDVTKMDLSDLEEGLYQFSVTSYDMSVYSAVLDIYRSSGSAVWAKELSASTVKAGRVVTTELGWSGKDITNLLEGEGYQIVDASTITDSTHPLYGKTGKFVKLTSINSAEQLTYSVIPSHTKSYYKELLGLKDYVLSVDFYMTGSYKGMSAIGAYHDKDMRYREYATWRGSAPVTNKWQTYSISFDSYLIPESAEESFSNTYFDFNDIGTKVTARNTLFQFEASSADCVIYASLPYIDTMPEFIHTSTTERTIDMLGVKKYDLTQLFSQNELAKYRYYGEKYGFDKFFFRVNLAESYSTIIWADDNGRIMLDLSTVVGTNEAGVSVTVFDLIKLGTFTIDGKFCDIYNFPGHHNVGVFGSASGCNNNQTIAKFGEITLVNRPDQVEVYEIAVADSTYKIMRDDYSSTRMSENITEGNVKSLYVDSVQDLDKSLNVNVFKNETEAGQIQIVSKTDVAEYGIIVPDFVCGNNILKKENISVYHMLYTYVARNSAGGISPTGIGEYPDAILPMDVALENGAATLKAGKNQGVWLSFSIPADQPSGVYTGIIRVVVGESVYEVPVSVNVYDYTVVEETRMITALSLSYSDILNLETEGEFDENGNLILNSSGNKTGTVPDEIIDAYIDYLADHKVSTSVVVKSSSFSGSWQGYPYDPNALFSFDKITVNGKKYYSYEWTLRRKDADGNTILVAHVDNRTGYTTHGYPLYLDRVDEYFNQMVKLASNTGITSYTLPVGQAVVSNFAIENVSDTTLYPRGWAGQMNEIRDDMPNGVKAYTINQLVLRDAIEMFFVKAMDLHKAGTSVDVFRKARIYPTWIDEFGISESKTLNAQYLLKYMKDFFPNCAEWLKRVYADQINGDTFLLSMLDSLSKVKIGVTTNTVEDVDPSIHYANLIPVLGMLNSQSGRDDINNWADVAYGGEAQKWVYTAGNSFPESSNNIDQPYITNRIIGWIMSEYDIEGYLYWATMRSKYEDGIVASTIKPIIGETVKDGDLIKLDDFYNNAIHYGGVAGDGFLMYPGRYYNVTGPVGTIRVEALADSIEDYDLFYDLKEMYHNAGIEESYYSVMRRLCEMLYTGVKSKVPNGYTNDFQISRDSLANMLIMARDNKVFADDVYFDDDLNKWVFTVIAPSDTANAVKSSINATFISSESLSLYGGTGVKMKFAVSSQMVENGYVTISFDNKTINLSVETLIETAEVEELSWAKIDGDETITYHNSYYSNGASGVMVDYEMVTLSEENAVGGRTSGNYYYVSPVNNSTGNVGIAVLPETLTKEDVAKYIGKAQLVFDIYMETTYISDGSLVDTWKVWYKLGKATNSQTECHSWFSVTIDFGLIYEHWDTLMNTSPATFRGSNDDWSTSRRSLFSVNGASHSAEGVHTTSFYMGNFRIMHT